MMNLVIEQLPKIIRYTGILAILFLIVAVLSLLDFIFALTQSVSGAIMQLITLLLVGFQHWLFRGYNHACKLALESRSSSDIELACRQQSKVLKFYGILSLLMLVSMVIGTLTVLGGGLLLKWG